MACGRAVTLALGFGNLCVRKAKPQSLNQLCVFRESVKFRIRVRVWEMNFKRFLGREKVLEMSF